MVRLPLSEFTFERFGNYVPEYIYGSSNKLLFVNWLIEQDVLGFSPQNNCEITPRPEDMAVMFNRNGRRYWGHVLTKVWNIYLKQIAKIKRFKELQTEIKLAE